MQETTATQLTRKNVVATTGKKKYNNGKSKKGKIPGGGAMP
jgi:hypothetical protein